MANMGDDQVRIEAEPGKGYALSGKIMLTAIVILFAVVVFMVGLHLYARWYLVRLRRRQLERRRGRAVGRRVSRTQILMYVDNRNPGADRGLELPVLNSLPVFLFPAVKADEPPMECAVCLSEFIKGDIVRMLPKCSHTFHLECIDMWFHSHSTCPNCRSAVELAPDTIFAAGKPLSFMAKKPSGPDPGSSSGSGLCSTCQHEGSRDSNSTLSESDRRRKGLDLGRIEVPPRRNESESELTQSSPAGRFLSRILSMGRKSPTTAGTSRELDLESPLGESTQGQAPSLELGSMEPPPRRNESENELSQGSPAGRFLSRILSMGRKSPFPSPTTPCGARTSREVDLESGPSESTRGQAPC